MTAEQTNSNENPLILYCNRTTTSTDTVFQCYSYVQCTVALYRHKSTNFISLFTSRNAGQCNITMLILNRNDCSFGGVCLFHKQKPCACSKVKAVESRFHCNKKKKIVQETVLFHIELRRQNVVFPPN